MNSIMGILSLAFRLFLALQSDSTLQARDLIEKLHSGKIEERDEATRKLKELGKDALPELEKATRDGDSEVAGRAKYLLEVIALRGTLSPTLRKVLPGLEDRLALGGHTWTQVLLTLIRVHPNEERVYPDLKKEDLLALAGPGVREARTVEEKVEICQLLVNDPFAREVLSPASPEIIKLLQDGNASVRSSAADALGSLGAKETIPKILKLLKDDDADVCTSAINALLSLGAKESVPEILKLLKDDDASVRREAVHALGILEAKESVPELVVLLNDDDALVRGNAAGALGILGKKETAPKILKLLKDDQWLVRSSAAEALGRLGAKESVPELVKLLKDDGVFVCAKAAEALGRLGAKETAPEILKLLKDKDETVRSSAVDALGRLGTKETVLELVTLLRDERGEVRSSAAFVLWILGAKETAPEILKLLRDKDGTVRSNAAFVLGRLRVKETGPDLVKLLKDEDGRVRSQVADALGRLGAKETAPELVKLLTDGPDVSSSAALSLCRFGLKDGVPLLLEFARMKSKNFWVALCPLNSLRRPDIWERLREVGLDRDLEGTIPQVVQEIGRKAGLRVLVPAKDETYFTPSRIEIRGGHTSLLEGLEKILPGSEYEIIFESDSIRILPREEALKFWHDWWKEQQDKK
jgi:HEAT repeat protein